MYVLCVLACVSVFSVLFQEILEPIEVAALLISAVIHDLDHPARTNPYMCNSRDELALLYNDRCVLACEHYNNYYKLLSTFQ